MDFSVILMLVIMVACAIALIGFSNKEAKRKDEPELPPVPEDGPGLKGDPGPKPEPEPESVGEPDPGPTKGKKLEIDPGPPVISIYSCEAKRGAKICPYCDGENTEDARTCQICRQDI